MSENSNPIRLQLQALERRENPSVSVALMGATLVLTGDSASDVAIVTERGNQIVVQVSESGNIQGIPGAKPGQTVVAIAKNRIGTIMFSGGEANDIFLNSTTHGAFVDGGAGDDTLVAGRSRRGDTLIGGDGNDVLIGNGNAIVFGGSGRDVFASNRGRDRIIDDNPNEDQALGGDRRGGLGVEVGDDRGAR